MSIRTVTHLNFRGTARAALAFYHDVFKGQQTLVTYAQTGRADDAVNPDDIIWGQVTSEDGFAIMAYDVQADLDWHAGSNAFFISLRGDDADAVRRLWEGLQDGGVVLQELGPSAWSPLYGMLRDRFGVTWVVDVAVPYAPA
jgi:PhnB protein